MNKRQWSLNQNTTILIQENEFQDVVCKIAALYVSLNVLI